MHAKSRELDRGKKAGEYISPLKESLLIWDFRMDPIGNGKKFIVTSGCEGI